MMFFDLIAQVHVILLFYEQTSRKHKAIVLASMTRQIKEKAMTLPAGLIGYLRNN